MSRDRKKFGRGRNGGKFKSCVNFEKTYIHIYIKISEHKEAAYNSRSWIKSDRKKFGRGRNGGKFKSY